MASIESTFDLKKCGLLIVDDDETIRDCVEEMCVTVGYSAVYKACDGLEALGLLQIHGEGISLVLLDMKMPRMGGAELIKHLLNIHKIPVGIIIITAYSSVASATEFFRISSDTVLPLNYLVKPILMEKLLDDVEDALIAVSCKRRELAKYHDARFEERLDRLEAAMLDLSRRHPGFLASLGLDVVRTLIIAFAFLGVLFLGAGDFIRVILQKVR
ncbi:MAG: response regulator [candidate division NC10 bacterium]|nr:response regulator [candidate division NC10 bacterium]